MLKVIYFGTAEFAVAPLKALLAAPDQFAVVAVVSQPDKPSGRKQELTSAPVVKLARERGLNLMQPSRLKDAALQDALAALQSDVFIVASYGRIIPQALLDIPKIAPLNLHGSLLPKYRGASPIQAAILAGEAVTGVSFMVMDAEMDHGPVISMVEVPVASNDTHDSLEIKLSVAGTSLLLRDLDSFCSGKLTAKEQDHSAATFTTLIDKQAGLINWQAESADHVENKSRAYNPWPGAHFVWNRQGAPVRIKLISAKVINTPAGLPVGQSFVSADGNPAIATVSGSVELHEVQPEGKKAMPGKAFLNGYKDFPGSIF